MGGARIAGDDRSMTVRVPITIKRRSGRKLVLAPDGAEITAAPVTRHIDKARVKAIARAFRWRELLEDGSFCTIAEVTAAENINETYVGRVVRLTLLAPDIVETILTGRQAIRLQLDQLLRPFPLQWERQRHQLGLTSC